MKIVRPICCGLDIHKNLIVATIASTDSNNITTYIQQDFSTFNWDLFRLRDWLIEHNCFDVCMESTGKYWIPVFNILEQDINVYLTHPKYVKAIKGKKTDKKDSKWISDVFKHDLLRFSFIPPKPIRELREISRYRMKLVYIRSSERNRYQNSMTVSNISLASVFSDPLGKSCKAVMREVLNGTIIDDDSLLKILHGSVSKKSQLIKDAIKDSYIEADQRFKLQLCMEHMNHLDNYIESCEVEMVKRCASFFDIVLHISTLPGISLTSAMIILSEIGTDMTVWENDKELISWAGLCPENNESAHKKKSVRVSKAGQYLKPILVQCALAAIKSTKEPYFKVKYHRIKKRRGHKKAIIATARKLLISIYHMILTGEIFNPSDYESFQKPESKSKQNDTANITTQQALEHLKSIGVDISNIEIPEP